MSKLTMTLLSDALPGSGEGLAGFIDTDITFDEYGIPYIPAKRIKGILKESAEELFDAGVISIKPNEIFGSPGSKESCDFKISNGILADTMKYNKFFKLGSDQNKISSVFNRESVLEYFTYTRSQTAIENGTAKENSLRIGRVLRKGLKFEFDLEFNPAHKESMEKIVKVTRFFGHNRTRGLGNIRMTLNGSEEDISTNNVGNIVNTPNFSENELCRITFTLTNLSQLLLSVRIGEDQTTETYIPGSIILGALANNYIKKCGINPAKDPDFRDIFISGNVVFENAYPLIDNKIFQPVPLSFVMEKDSQKIHDKTLEDTQQKIEKGEIKPKGAPGGYAYLGGPEASITSCLTQVSYHHRRPEDNSIGHARKEEQGNNDGEFFQFEVLAPNQSFKGEITGSYKSLQKLAESLKSEMNIYIGKSKTAQYGRCIVKFDKIENTPKTDSIWEDGEELIIIFKSDMILINDKGFPDPDVDIFLNKFLELFGIKRNSIDEKLKFLKHKTVGGYLGVWNLPKAQMPAISAGSVIVLKNESGNIDISNSLVNSYGARIEEGFGRISAHKKGFKNIGNAERETGGDSGYDGGLDEFVQYIVKNKIKKCLSKKAMEKSIEIAKTEPSGSFIGRLQLIISGINDERSAFKEFSDKLSEFKEPAMKHLAKIKDNLFISIKDGKIEILKDKFISVVKQAPDTNSVLTAIFGNNDVKVKSDQFYDKNDFDFYKDYVLKCLSNAKFRMRGGKKDGQNN